MSTLKTKKVQLGDNADPSKNFVLSVPAVADGTLSIKRQDGTNVLSIATDGGFNLQVPKREWTPVVSGATSTGVGTYTVQVGYYWDFGTLFYVTARVEWSDHTGTGAMRVNLPFAPDPSTIVPLATYANGLNVGTNNTPLLMRASSDTGKELQVYGINNVSGGTVSIPSMDTVGAIAFSGWLPKLT